MRKIQSYQKPNLLFYQAISTFSLLFLLLSLTLFLYFFFYRSLHDTYQSFKQEQQGLVPIYDTPEISIPDLSPKVEESSTIVENIPVSNVLAEDLKIAEKIFVAYELGDYMLASRLIVDFLSEYPESPYQYKVRLIGAKLMNERGDYEGALGYIQKILGEMQLDNQEYSETVLLLGSISRERKQYDSYIQSFLEQAYFRAEEPTKSKLSFYLGYLLLHKGDHFSSLKYFNNVIGEDGVLGKADLYKAQMMRPERINELENFIKSYPSSKNFDYVQKSFIEDNLAQGEELVLRGYLDSAERFFQKIITYFPDTAEGDKAQIKIAEVYYQKQNYDQAKRFLHEVLKNENNFYDPDALFELGKISFELDEQELALGYFRNLIEKYPRSPYIAKAQEWQDLIFESLRN